VGFEKTIRGRILMGARYKSCIRCGSPIVRKKDDWLGPQSKFCRMRCKSEHLSSIFSKLKTEGLDEETREWYTEFTSGKYTSLRHFCRENNIVPMTASLRFRKYIPEYSGRRKNVLRDTQAKQNCCNQTRS